MLAGLIIAPAVVPTIWVLQGIGLFRNFLATVPRELDESAVIDGAGPDILLITVPPLLMFLVANRRIVAGLTSGAVKG